MRWNTSRRRTPRPRHKAGAERRSPEKQALRPPPTALQMRDSRALIIIGAVEIVLAVVGIVMAVAVAGVPVS